MVNIERLKTALKDQSLSIDQVAEALDCDRATVYRRFQQSAKFTVDEVDRLSKLLNLSAEKMQQIFFDQELA